MERLRLDFIQLNKALKTVGEALSLLQQTRSQGKSEAAILVLLEDGVVKRFEFTYETFWKFLKKYIEHIHDKQDINSPKKIFLTCVELEICFLAEGDIFIEMANSRNETTHRYSAETSRIIFSEIPRYYVTMLAVVERIGKKLPELRI